MGSRDAHAPDMRPDARVPPRVCCRREAARTGASLAAAEQTGAMQLAELHSVKRRLRQYAATLDAVSVRAKEEIGVALTARNEAREDAASAATERDAFAARSDALGDALAAVRADLASSARAHEVADIAYREAATDCDALRGALATASRTADEARAAADAAAADRDASASELARERMARRAAATERDSLQDALADARAQLAAAQREVALMRHQLATQAPPEISAAVRRDIAERAAEAVERRTLGLIRAIAEHYLTFGPGCADLPPALAHVVGVDTDDDVSETEADATLADQIRAMPPIPSVSPDALEDVVRQTARAIGIDPDAIPDDTANLSEADGLLQHHLAFAKTLSANVDASPEDTAVAEDDSIPVAEDGSAPLADEPAAPSTKVEHAHITLETKGSIPTPDDAGADEETETSEVAERSAVFEAPSAKRAFGIKAFPSASASGVPEHAEEDILIEAVTDEPGEDAQLSYDHLDEVVAGTAAVDDTPLDESVEYLEPTAADMAGRDFSAGVKIMDRPVDGEESIAVENDEQIGHRPTEIEEALYEANVRSSSHVKLAEPRELFDVSGDTPPNECESADEEAAMLDEPETAVHVDHSRIAQAVTDIQIDPVTEESVCAAAFFNQASAGSIVISPRGEVGPIKEEDEADVGEEAAEELIINLSSPPAHEAIIKEVPESTWIDVADIVDDEDTVAALEHVPVVAKDIAPGPPKVVTMDDDNDILSPEQQRSVHTVRSMPPGSFFLSAGTIAEDSTQNAPIESPMSVKDFSRSVHHPAGLSHFKKSEGDAASRSASMSMSSSDSESDLDSTLFGEADDIDLDDLDLDSTTDGGTDTDSDLDSRHARGADEDIYRNDDVDEVLNLTKNSDDDSDSLDFTPMMKSNVRSMPFNPESTPASTTPVEGESMQFSDDEDVDYTLDCTLIQPDDILPTNVEDNHTSDEEFADDFNVDDTGIDVDGDDEDDDDDGSPFAGRQPWSSPMFRGPAFGRSPFGRSSFGRPPFGRPPFGQPPFESFPHAFGGRHPFMRRPSGQPDMGPGSSGDEVDSDLDSGSNDSSNWESDTEDITELTEQTETTGKTGLTEETVQTEQTATTKGTEQTETTEHTKPLEATSKLSKGELPARPELAELQQQQRKRDEKLAGQKAVDATSKQ